MSSLKNLSNELETSGREEDATAVRELVEEGMKAGETRMTFLVKGCNHFVSSFKDLRISTATTLYEKIEFACPLCSKASNIAVPVFSKWLRDALLAKQDPKVSPPDLFGLVKKIEEITNLDEKFETCFSSYGYSDSSLAVIETEYGHAKQVDQWLSTMCTFFIEMKARAMGVHGLSMHSQDMFTEFLLIVEIRGFADTVKALGQAMEGVYLAKRVMVTHWYQLWTEYKQSTEEYLEIQEKEMKWEPLRLDYLRLTGKLREACVDLRALADDEILKKADIHELFARLADRLVGLPH